MPCTAASSLAAWVTLAGGLVLKFSTILIKFRRLSPREAVFSSSAAQLIDFIPDFSFAGMITTA
jgi:hypothetical protein